MVMCLGVVKQLLPEFQQRPCARGARRPQVGKLFLDDPYDQLWDSLVERHGRQKGTKELIELLQLGRRCGQEKLRAAVEQALALGCRDSAAVRYLLSASLLERAVRSPLAVGDAALSSEQALAAFERPLPTVTDYDQLLVGLTRGPFEVSTSTSSISTLTSMASTSRTSVEVEPAGRSAR